MKRIIIISLLFVACVSCTTKQPKVIFSSENLDSVQWIIQTYDSVSDTWISPKENQLWCLGRDGTMFDYSQGYGNEYARLPDYKDYQIVIACNDAGDNVPIDLCVVKSGIMMLNNALDITHSWLDYDEDEQGNVIEKVTIKEVVIYEGYLICIKTYEQIDYEQRKYVRTNYYKINDDGDFYEVDSSGNPIDNVWDNVPIQKLPFSMTDSDRNSVLQWMLTQETFNKHFNISPETNEMDKMFHRDNGWKHLSLDFDFKSNEQGHFIKRLPDVNHNKVLLFAVYDDKMNDDVGFGIKVWTQLQTFDSDGKFIDKLIVYANMGSECRFSRNFTYDEKNVIRLKDRKRCVDVSADDPNETVYDAIATYAYWIDDDGKIVEVPQEHTEEILVDRFAEEFSEPKMPLDSNAMFSSKDLVVAQWMLSEEFPLSVLEYDGKISDNTALLTRLPDYNGDTVVISKKIKGDGAVYTLYVVKSGVLQNGLDITPHYVVSKDKRAYSFKDFVINKDYRISIYTEEKEAGERPQSGGDYYRIDNFGEFYKANW
ncbi:MAG: hypothetical protein IKO90_08100 [Bacteroidales bacterium]|nr:hypothetical protein [Bacteroidales bacterium]